MRVRLGSYRLVKICELGSSLSHFGSDGCPDRDGDIERGEVTAAVREKLAEGRLAANAFV